MKCDLEADSDDIRIFHFMGIQETTLTIFFPASVEVADPARTGVEHAVFTAYICLRIRCVSVFAFRVHVLPRLLLGFSVLLTTTCLVSDLHRFAAARPNLGG